MSNQPGSNEKLGIIITHSITWATKAFYVRTVFQLRYFIQHPFVFRKVVVTEVVFHLIASKMMMSVNDEKKQYENRCHDLLDE